MIRITNHASESKDLLSCTEPSFKLPFVEAS